jgi:hypothetical protein
MTALSNLFAWIWLLLPGSGLFAPMGDQAELNEQEIQPCSAAVEDVCEEPQASSKKEKAKKTPPIRQIWRNANRNGISNGI